MTKKIGTINEFVKERNKSKILFTAGPASLLKENIIGLRPCFGRADKDYDNVERRVLTKIKKISGQKQIVRMQGSASLAIEIMSLNFLYGHVLVISTGYYSDRILWLAKSAKRRKKEITKISLDTGAIKLDPKNPFLWASGYRMPIYNDNRMLLGNAKHRQLIAKNFRTILNDKNIVIDVIAGTATAGIPPATSLANLMKTPLIYVRSATKNHGMKNQIEGILNGRESSRTMYSECQDFNDPTS